MAMRNLTRKPPSRPRHPTRWTLAVPPQPAAIRAGLVPRVIYFPEGWLARIEDKPGALVEVITMALAAYQTKGGAQ